jgi:hypothetical protein
MAVLTATSIIRVSGYLFISQSILLMTSLFISISLTVEENFDLTGLSFQALLSFLIIKAGAHSLFTKSKKRLVIFMTM